MSVDYSFTNTAAQMNPLTGYLDPVTAADLDAIGVRPGWRCLSLGAGAGTVAAMLHERVGPDGEVVAVDIDTTLFAGHRGLTVVQHDLRELPLPVQGGFDLVEARLVTQHLPNRAELLDAMIALVKPGGWILDGEFVNPRPQAITGDADLFGKVTGALLDTLESNGVTMTWGGHGVHTRLTAAGANVYTHWHAETWTGGGERIALYRDNVRQKHPQLLAHGLTSDEIDRFIAMLDDPALIVRSYEIAMTRAQFPA